MQVISASKFKQNVSVLQEALTDDILVTKENKPFVVIIDYNKYKEIEKYNKIPNEITIKAINNLENNQDIKTFNSKKDFFDDLDI